MADLRGSVLKRKGGQVTQKYGGPQPTSGGTTHLRKESHTHGEQSINNSNESLRSVEKALLDFKHGGNENDNANAFAGWDDFIAIKNCPTSVVGVSTDDVGPVLDTSAMAANDNIEWITTTVDSLGRIVFESLDFQTAAVDNEGESGAGQPTTNAADVLFTSAAVNGISNGVISKPGVTSILATSLNTSNSIDGLLNTSKSLLQSGQNIFSSTSLPQNQGISLLQTRPVSDGDEKITSGVGRVQDAAQQGHIAFTVGDNGLERLSSADRACLDEIGSILSREETELLENNKKELQSGLQPLDFNDLEQDRSLFTSQDLVNMPDFDEDDENDQDLKPCFSNIIIQNIPDAEVMENLNMPETTSSVHPGSIMTTTSASSVVNATAALSTDPSITINSQVDPGTKPAAPSTQDTLQIVLYDDVGKEQVINISQNAIRNSIMKFRAKDGNTETNSANNKAVVNLSSVTVQDGFLVIPVDATTAENLPDSVDNHEPLVRTVNKQGQGDSVPKQWMCYLCGKVYARLSKLKVHIMQHTGERPYKCTHKGCKWAFTVAHKLRRHMERHSGSKLFLCEEEGCGKRFTTIYNLRTHQKIHKKPCTDVCSQPGCGQGFRNRRLLDVHMSKAHNIITGCYPCPHPDCDRTFTSPYCIGSHMRVHQRAELVCTVEGCGKEFTKKCRLLQHMRKHTGERPFKCQVEGCKWAFCSSSKLRRHMHKHTNQRQYVCDQEGCGKRFLRAEHLKGHLITHTGLKPFSCPQEGCTARFSSKSSMYVHVKRHRQLSNAQNLMEYDTGDTEELPVTNSPKIIQVVNLNEQGTLQLGAAAPQQISLLGGKSVMGSSGATKSRSLLQLPSISTSVTPVSSSSIQHVFTQAAPVMLSPPQQQQQQLTMTPVVTPSSSAMLSVPIVITPDLANISQDVVNVGGLSLSAGPTGLGTLAPTLANGTKSSSPVSQTSAHGRSARTDPHTNELLCEKARRRRRLKRQGTEAISTPELASMSPKNLPPPVAITSPRQHYDSAHILSGSNSLLTATNTVNPNEIMTSRAITFRDPETGAITIQTQLLQDDPPDVYADEAGAMLEGPGSLDATDLASILMESHQVHDLADTLSVAIEYGRGHSDLETTSSSVFTGTTINLQDLE